MQRAQPDDRSRHAGLRPDPLTRNREGETRPPVYSRTNAMNISHGGNQQMISDKEQVGLY
jgi:hypothetical protein